MEVGAKVIQDAGCISEITSTYNLLNELSCHLIYVQLQKALLHKIKHMCSNIPSPAGCRCIPGTVEWSLLGRLGSWLWPEWTCSNLTGLHTRGKKRAEFPAVLFHSMSSVVKWNNYTLLSVYSVVLAFKSSWASSFKQIPNKSNFWCLWAPSLYREVFDRKHHSY